VINVPPQAAGTSIGAGTQLNLFDGGALPFNFHTSPGSELNITGGSVGESIDTFGSVNLSGGSIGNFYRSEGNELNVTGGSIGIGFVGADVDLDVSGGEIGDGAFVNSASEVQISGGRLGHNFQSNGLTYISGGAFGDGLQVDYDLSGSDFRINGAVVDGLVNIGDATTVNVDFDFGFGSVLTGVFSDGTPLAFTRQEGDRTAGFDELGTVTLRMTALPPIQPFRSASTSSSARLGVRDGETLLVDAAVGDHFNAGRGSVVEVVDGGSIGENFEAAAATVNIRGGAIGESFSVFAGSIVNISGGSVAVVDSTPVPTFKIYDGAVVNIFGGKVGGMFGSGHANIFGGTTKIVGLGSAHYRGREFFINGTPINGLNLGQPTVVNISAGGTLSGILADGTPFSQSLGGPPLPPIARPIGALTVTLVPEPGGGAFAPLVLAGVHVALRRRCV
jgi:hypothetical protein